MKEYKKEDAVSKEINRNKGKKMSKNIVHQQSLSKIVINVVATWWRNDKKNGNKGGIDFDCYYLFCQL